MEYRRQVLREDVEFEVLLRDIYFCGAIQQRAAYTHLEIEICEHLTPLCSFYYLVWSTLLQRGPDLYR